MQSLPSDEGSFVEAQEDEELDDQGKEKLLTYSYIYIEQQKRKGKLPQCLKRNQLSLRKQHPRAGPLS